MIAADASRTVLHDRRDHFVRKGTKTHASTTDKLFSCRFCTVLSREADSLTTVHAPFGSLHDRLVMIAPILTLVGKEQGFCCSMQGFSYIAI